MADVRQRRGRSPERVYATPPSKSLECVVCLNIRLEPVSLPACGHTFCRGCVASVLAKPAAQRKCPNCRKDVARSVAAAALPLNWTVKSSLDELCVRCRYGVKEEGDGWMADEAGYPAQLTLDGAAAHEAACGFATTTTCPFAGCGVELRRDQADAHDAAFAVAHARGERAARLLSEARLSAVETSAASTRGELSGERAARLADATTLEATASATSRLEASFAAATSCVALLEARLAALKRRLPTMLGAPLAPPVPPTLSNGWAARRMIQAELQSFAACSVQIAIRYVLPSRAAR